MAVLGNTIAELLARVQAGTASARQSPLQEVQGFGDNPGALRMLVYTPDALASVGALVVVLHGCGQTAAGYAEGAGWLDLADRYGFVVLCPEQTSSNNINRCFNWFSPHDVARGSGEIASIAEMVQRAMTDHAVDPRRVFITGLSAGGAMTAALLAAYPELFAAGAVIAGLPYGAADNVQEALAAMRHVPTRSAKAWGDKVRQAAPKAGPWPRIAIWHGDADTTVSPQAADAIALQWTNVHGVTAPIQEKTSSPRHSHTVWRTSDGQVVVELHRIAGLGHGTPIAATGPEGCGAAAPWILEAGLSSSLQLARSWGLADVERSTPAKPAREDAGADARAQPKPTPSPRIDVGEVISRALKGSGLLR